MAWTTLARLAKQGTVERVARSVYQLSDTLAHKHPEVRPPGYSWRQTRRSGIAHRARCGRLQRSMTFASGQAIPTSSLCRRGAADDANLLRYLCNLSWPA